MTIKDINSEVAQILGENMAKAIGMKTGNDYSDVVIKAYGNMVAFALAPLYGLGDFSVPLGPITEAEYLRRKKRDEDYEKGRLLYEQAKELGFYADCDCDD